MFGKDSYRFFEQKFSQYNSDNLINVDAKEFENKLKSWLGKVDYEVEGYSEDEVARQRDLSIKFHWGHNHHFGSFNLSGRMGNRHIELMSDFSELFSLTQDTFADKSILDVGCWTGGTTLLLAACGAKSVVAIEEVKKYADAADYLVRSFLPKEKAKVEARSIYQCDEPDFKKAFDVVYFPGVVYHLSDPVLALRILFNALKIGGCILIESSGINSDQPYCQYDGAGVFHKNDRESQKQLNRGGWNWFRPSPKALARMMRDAGFVNVESCWHGKRGRVFAIGKKIDERGICKAGLSVPDIE